MVGGVFCVLLVVVVLSWRLLDDTSSCSNQRSHLIQDNTMRNVLLLAISLLLE